MHAFLLTAALAAGPETTTADVSRAAEAVARHATSGTLLFSRGDCLAVKTFTGSPFTHVAAVVEEDGRFVVYDSANGSGVRRQTLREYVATARPDRMCVVNPARRFSPRCRETFRRQLSEEVGRPYSVSHHVTGRPAEGLHCSEYVTTALVECELLTARNAAKVSPGSLYDGIVDGRVYEEVCRVNVDPSVTDRLVGDNWCHQFWIDTKACCRGWSRGLSRRFLCR